MALARLRAQPCCYLCAWKPPYSQLGKWTRYISRPSLGNRLEGMEKAARPLLGEPHAQLREPSLWLTHAMRKPLQHQQQQFMQALSWSPINLQCLNLSVRADGKDDEAGLLEGLVNHVISRRRARIACYGVGVNWTKRTKYASLFKLCNGSARLSTPNGAFDRALSRRQPRPKQRLVSG